MRRSSINEDLLRRRFSRAASTRTSLALESLALIPDIDESTRHYGAADDDDAPQDQLQRGPSWRERRKSILDEGALLKDELLGMISLAVPVIATYLLEIVPGIITIMLVGRMDNGETTQVYIDAAALAVMYFNIVCLSTGLGLLTALDTLYASAHGANQPEKMGRYLLTGIALMTVTLCVVGTIICNTTRALLFFGQPPAVAREAGVFAIYMLPGLPFLYGYELLRKLSQARNETLPMIVSAVTSVLVNIVVGYWMVNHTSWGWLGAAIARSVGYMVLLPTVYLGMYRSDREFLSHVKAGFRVREAITMRAFRKFLSLGIPGMLQFMFEWVAFEVIALLCGLFPDPQEAIVAIGSNAIVFQISTLVYMLYLGASMAGNVRIGNALGAGDAHRAKMACYLTLALGIFISAINIAFLLGFRHRLPYLFTSDAELIEKAQDLFVVVALYQFPDALDGVEQGIFRAIGKQALAAKLNFVAYYIIGIPLGYILAIPFGMGVEGLWYGMTVGLCFVSTVLTVVLLRCDWQELSLETRKRLSIAVQAAEVIPASLI
ncbi:hypothetical protein ACHAXT_008883 [Thalassiosira profunda]